MKTKETMAEALSTCLNQSKIATMNQLKSALKTNSRMTVFRKLSKPGYVSSCSHSGKYYALKRTARFNKHGIWRHDSVLFSKHGTLKNTLKILIANSVKGFTAAELNSILKVKVEDSLYILVKEKAVCREKISGVFVYFSEKSKSKKKQALSRSGGFQSDGMATKSERQTDELKAALVVFFSTLDEKQRRLYAGYESLKRGRGGDKLIAEILKLDRKTVARGRRELLGGKIDVDTIRNSGGGRNHVKKNSPM